MPFRIRVVQTDNGAEFQSRFHGHLEERDIRHVYIRPRTPHLNGKVERSHRVDDQEFYQLLDRHGITDDIRLFNDKLREWEDYYNYHRPHGALDGQTPYERHHGQAEGRSVTRVLSPYTRTATPLLTWDERKFAAKPYRPHGLLELNRQDALADVRNWPTECGTALTTVPRSAEWR